METDMVTNALENFDPTKYLTKLKKGPKVSDYLEVKWRLVWLRKEHPDAAINTEILLLDYPNKVAVIKATITIPGGGSASGIGMEERGDFHDFAEKAETKALGRAAAALGFGTQFTEDFDFGDNEQEEKGERKKVVDSPVSRPNPPRPMQQEAIKQGLKQVSPPRPDATKVREDEQGIVWSVGGVECRLKGSQKAQWLTSEKKCTEHPDQSFNLYLNDEPDQWRHKDGQGVCKAYQE